MARHRQIPAHGRQSGAYLGEPYSCRVTAK
jgi:hypothetical protein